MPSSTPGTWHPLQAGEHTRVGCQKRGSRAAPRAAHGRPQLCPSPPASRRGLKRQSKGELRAAALSVPHAGHGGVGPWHTQQLTNANSQRLLSPLPAAVPSFCSCPSCCPPGSPMGSNFSASASASAQLLSPLVCHSATLSLPLSTALGGSCPPPCTPSRETWGLHSQLGHSTPTSATPRGLFHRGRRASDAA